MIVPDFNSVVAESITLPYDPTKEFLLLRFTDPLLKDYSLIVILDSHLGRTAFGERITTMILRYPRYVHAEALRHRVISRNAASSRARSVKSTLRDVMENPVIPLFTVNQKGMGGRFSDAETRAKQIEAWLKARDAAVASVLELLVGSEIFDNYGSGFRDVSGVAENWEEILEDYYENGYDSEGNAKDGYLSTHKQQFNRLLEPFSQFEEVITGTYWDNFLSLRDHPDAQPEIKAPAVLVREALRLSKPEARDFHLPFIAEEDVPAITADWEEAIKPVFLRASAEAAQISYNDKSKAARTTASSNLGERLFESRHYSPFEHSAIADTAYLAIARRAELVTDLTKLVSNFDSSWVQLRPILAGITK